MGNSYNLDKQCVDLRRTFKRCEKAWLAGEPDVNEEDCKQAFDDYKVCILEYLKERQQQHHDRNQTGGVVSIEGRSLRVTFPEKEKQKASKDASSGS